MKKYFNKKHIAKIVLFVVLILFFIFLVIFTPAPNDVRSSKHINTQKNNDIMFEMK